MLLAGGMYGMRARVSGVQILVDFVSIRMRAIVNWKCCFQTLSHVFENRSVIAPDNAKLCPKYPPMHVSRTARTGNFLYN